MLSLRGGVKGIPEPKTGLSQSDEGLVQALTQALNSTPSSRWSDFEGDIEAMPETASRDAFLADRDALPSLGSALHDVGACSPCAWFWKAEGCRSGTACVRCHLCPENATKLRRKAKRQSAAFAVAEASRPGAAGGIRPPHGRLPSQQVEKSVHEQVGQGPPGKTPSRLALSVLLDPQADRCPSKPPEDAELAPQVMTVAAFERGLTAGPGGGAALPTLTVPEASRPLTHSGEQAPGCKATLSETGPTLLAAKQVTSSEKQGCRSTPAAFAMKDDGLLPSLGSVLHASGTCRPCAWFWKSVGCQNGSECQHCHLCPDGELKRRKKVRALQRTTVAPPPVPAPSSVVAWAPPMPDAGPAATSSVRQSVDAAPATRPGRAPDAVAALAPRSSEPPLGGWAPPGGSQQSAASMRSQGPSPLRALPLRSGTCGPGSSGPPPTSVLLPSSSSSGSGRGGDAAADLAAVTASAGCLVARAGSSLVGEPGVQLLKGFLASEPEDKDRVRTPVCIDAPGTAAVALAPVLEAPDATPSNRKVFKLKNRKLSRVELQNLVPK
mmetsp:Transcript_58003/g.168254  ORF Transcript_58003/g.168254 Transcript_58003/m.168254 type:complete len:552 (+) Transcript_58003:77-1732(+)